ncbi:MAG TPA: hypothetical protein VJ464_03885 [Blastocatellia bacterium]|nr:hypothetical protein [Blastocatellia bacterium]
MADELKRLVDALAAAHGDNLRSVVLYGASVVSGLVDDEVPKRILVVLDRIAPHDLHVAQPLAENWRLEGNPLPVYFTTEEIADAADVFPIEFIDMSQVRHVLYGKDPFERLDIQTHNLRHQLEYELRAKLLRLRRLAIAAAHNPQRLTELMANSLDSFAVLFRHVLAMAGHDAPFARRDCVMKTAEVLKLDQKVFARIFEYADTEGVGLQSETDATFAGYLKQIERVIDVVDKLPDE